MARTRRPQQHQISWPLTASQVEGLNEMLGTLFRAVNSASIGEGDIKSDGSVPFAAAESMGAHNITDVADPVLPQDAATKAYVDASGGTGDIRSDGSVPFAADESMGGHNLTNLAAPAGANDATRKTYVDTADGILATADLDFIKKDGSRAFTGDQSLGSHKLTNVTDPASAQDAATKAYVDAHSGTGKMVQVVNTETGAVATGTTIIPFDDTIPQNTEGDQYMTLAITPTSSTNKLRIDVVIFATVTTTPWIIAALFQDSAANALATMAAFNNLSTAGMTISFTHYMAAGTTSATTFKVRIGPSSAATVTFNGQSAGRKFGGVLASSITITEIVP